MGRRILQKMEGFQKFKRSNLIFFIKLFTILIFLFTGLQFFQKKGYIINISKSLPLGIYKTYEIKEELKIGDIVVFIPNKKNKEFMIERGYLKEKDLAKTLMKKIAGIEKDVFTVEKSELFGLVLKKNNKEELGFVSSQDRRFRNLPYINYLKLKKDEYFLIGESIFSYDSRYFGAVKREEILYKAKPIFVF